MADVGEVLGLVVVGVTVRFYYRHKYYPLLGYMDAIKKESSMFELPETTDEETGDET